MKKRIAYLGIKGLPSKAGADRVVEAIVTGLDHKKYQPVVYCCRRTVASNVTIPGVELIRIPTVGGKYLHAPLLFLLAALHAFFFGKYDLVHVHNVEACFVLPILRLRFKVISTSHGAAQMRDKWGGLAKRLIRSTETPFVQWSNVVTSVSKPLQEHYQTFARKPVHYIPNGVDSNSKLNILQAQGILEDLGLKQGQYILFAAGRNIPTKGCHYLLEAFAQIDTDIKLLVVGDASHIPDYERKLKKMADDRVCFVPFISEKATLMGLLRLCRFFVFPSTVEAMSMMLLEAAEVGAPIVCSDIPENTNVVPQLARFFNSANVSDLRDQLVWAFDHHAEMEALAAEAKRFVGSEYRWGDIVEQYQALYFEMSDANVKPIQNASQQAAKNFSLQ